MNTPDLYAAWLTAGNNLQPVGTWIAHNWINLAIAISLAVTGWRIIRWAVRHDQPARGREGQ